MKVGDAVKFIGFKEYVPTREEFGIGIIIEVHEVRGVKRYTVTWPNNTIGNWLYADTLEVVNESR